MKILNTILSASVLLSCVLTACGCVDTHLELADTKAGEAQERAAISVCHEETVGYMNKMTSTTAYTGNAFHSCWRTSSQAFEYLDALAALAPQYLTKISSIGKTFEGRDIPVFRISTGNSQVKQALYGQGLIHAREWQSGSTVFYIIAGLVEGLLNANDTIVALFDKYDWYLTPILNIDGYEYTWTQGNRLWRMNRRVFTLNGETYYGVDLNRNFGPNEFFNLENSGKPGSITYPGSGVLSEPETLAIFSFLRSLPLELAGAIDIHMNSQTIIRPFSNQKTEAPEPFKSRLIALGDTIRTAMQKPGEIEYGNVMGGTGHYLAYGTFKDAVFLEFNNTPAYTLELELNVGGFISSQETIRDVGQRALESFVAFSAGVTEYWQGL